MLFGANRPRRVAVFISGSGSTLQALLDEHHDLQISLIVSNKRQALGAVKAKRFGKSVLWFSKEKDFDWLHEELLKRQIDAIFLAGFMKILPEGFVSHWRGRILNIHPSLLPLFPGLHAAEKSYEAGQNMGVSLHQVNEGVDEGKIFLQMKSLKQTDLERNDLEKSLIYLRRTEQHLLREAANRWKI